MARMDKYITRRDHNSSVRGVNDDAGTQTRYQENGNFHADPGIHFPAGFSDDAVDGFIAEPGVGKLAASAVSLVFRLRCRVFCGSGPGRESDLGTAD